MSGQEGGPAAGTRPAWARTNNASLVTGVLSVVLPCLGIPLGITAVVLGSSARRQAAPVTPGKAGIVCGWIGIALQSTAVFLFLWLAVATKEAVEELEADVDAAAETTIDEPGRPSSGDDPAAPDRTDTATTLTPPLRPPATVVVQVLNTSQVPGAANSLADELAGLGYLITEPANAPPDTDPAFTTVLFAPSYEQEAIAVAQALGLGADATSPLDNSPGIEPAGAQIVVVAGRAVTG